MAWSSTTLACATAGSGKWTNRWPRFASPPKEESIAPYTTGAAEQSIYTSAPKVELPAAALPPPSYHVGDDASPAAETAQRTNWGSAAWALPPTDSPTASHPLPPVD